MVARTRRKLIRLVQVAALNEYGGKGLPERPALRTVSQERQSFYLRSHRLRVGTFLSKKRLTKISIGQSMTNPGEIMKKDIYKSYTSRRWQSKRSLDSSAREGSTTRCTLERLARAWEVR